MSTQSKSRIPHCRQIGDITDLQWLTFLKVQEFCGGLPDDLTCHDVSDQVAAMFPELECRRGYFHRRGMGHSWLRFRDDHEVLIDPYPWATGSGPILLTIKSPVNPWRGLYVEDTESVTRDETPVRESCPACGSVRTHLLEPQYMRCLACGHTFAESNEIQ